jgi:hypothetical protein
MSGATRPAVLTLRKTNTLCAGEGFHLGQVPYSEDLDSDANDMEPDLVEPEFDQEAMAEAAALSAEDTDPTET